MNKEELPLWHLAATDPKAFFDLPDGFDRKQLRRSYGSLIKRFKPETHPQEFQQIRHAFETLDDNLRYGSRPKTEPLQENHWNSAVAESARSKESPKDEPFQKDADQQEILDAAPAEEPVPIFERVENEPPKELYQELSQKVKKTPYDYYALAVLSDLVSRQSDLMFFRWLLKGLSEYPLDGGLYRLLSNYLRQDVADEAVAQVIQATIKVIRDERFFQLTEPLWDRFLQLASFDIVKGVLSKCDRSVRDHRLRSKVAFYIHFLRSAMFKAEPEWIAQRLTWFDQHGSEISPDLENDLELLSWMLSYRQASVEFLNGSPIRESIDQVIRGYCEGGPLSSAPLIVSCQDTFGRQAQLLMEAFDVADEGPGVEAAINIYLMLVAEVADMIDLQPDASRQIEVERQSLIVLNELRLSIVELGGGIRWARFGINFGFPFTLSVVPLLFLLGLVPIAYTGILALIWLPLTILAYIFWIKPRWAEPRFDRRLQRKLRAIYDETWRPRLFRYFSSISAPVQYAINVIGRCASEQGDDSWIGAVFRFASDDPALRLYAQAQAFIR